MKRKNFLPVIMSLLGAALLNAADFRNLTLPEALKKAKDEKKIVFIDFFTTWCAPCKILDETTWKDQKVWEWFEATAIPLKIDAEKKVEIATQYRIEAYPTLLFLKADGTEMGRITGYKNGPDFLKEAMSILEGEDPYLWAKKILREKGETNPMARMEYARKMMQLGKSEEALPAYLWCYDEGRQNPYFRALGNSYVIMELGQLSKSYAPAKKALEERYEKGFLELRNKEIPWSRLQDVVSLHEALARDGKELLALYDELRPRAEEANKTAEIFGVFYQTLLHGRRYDQIAQNSNLPEKAANLLSEYQNQKKHPLTEKFQQQMAAALQEMRLGLIGEIYQVYVGLGRESEAKDLADKLLEAEAGAETYNSLAWNGFLSGRPLSENLRQAAKAHELALGKNKAILDSYARLLVHFKQADKAENLILEFLKTCRDERARASLHSLLEEIKKEPSRT